MTEYTQPPIPNIDIDSLSEVPDFIFNDVDILLDELRPAAQVSLESWRDSDNVRQRIHHQATGRKLHPRDAALLLAAEQHCTAVCKEYADTELARGTILEKVEAITTIANTSVDFIREKDNRKGKNAPPTAVNMATLRAFQASRIVALGMQQVVHDELMAIAADNEYTMPLTIRLTGVLGRNPTPAATPEGELARILATVHHQQPRQNFLLDAFRRCLPVEHELSDDFLRAGLTNSDPAIRPKLGAVMDSLQLHIKLMSEQRPSALPEQACATEGLAAYIAWLKEQEWPAELQQGLTEYAERERQTMIRKLEERLAPHFVPGREFYRITPPSKIE